jgi:hypothetical protein
LPDESVGVLVRSDTYDMRIFTGRTWWPLLGLLSTTIGS